MGAILLAVLFALIIPIILTIWYLPLFLKHRKIVREKGRYYFLALLMGIAAFIPSFVLQGAANIATKNLTLNAGFLKEAYSFVKILLVVAVVEEMCKFFLGNLILRRVPDLTEAGSMLILGMTGIGFELVEALQTLSNPLSGILRGITALHLFFQLWMGKYWWQANRAKLLGDLEQAKKLRLKTFLVPILMHAVFDYPILRVTSMVNATENPEEKTIIIAVVAGVFSLLFGIGCVIYLYRTALRTVKAERAAFEAAQQQALETATESAEPLS